MATQTLRFLGDQPGAPERVAPLEGIAMGLLGESD